METRFTWWALCEGNRSPQKVPVMLALIFFVVRLSIDRRPFWQNDLFGVLYDWVDATFIPQRMGTVLANWWLLCGQTHQTDYFDLCEDLQVAYTIVYVLAYAVYWLGRHNHVAKQFSASSLASAMSGPSALMWNNSCALLTEIASEGIIIWDVQHLDHSLVMRKWYCTNTLG